VSDGSADEDLVRVIAKMLAERGWFVDITASRINEHFVVKERPAAGWGLREVTASVTMCNCHQHKGGATTGGWYCQAHGQQL
jgi:hypothetical protein